VQRCAVSLFWQRLNWFSAATSGIHGTGRKSKPTKTAVFFFKPNQNRPTLASRKP